MKKSLVCLPVLLSVLFLAVVLSPSGASAEKHEKLYGELKDIKGWKGEEPEGMAMDMPGMKMVQAMRIYKKDKVEISAMIMIGNAASAAASMQQHGEAKFESSDAKAETKEIDGFTVHIIYDKKDRSGGITVLLNPTETETSVFVLSFEDLDEKEALALARSFDWKSMKKTTGSLD
ncbi:MAG: hypothetical protein JW814_06380 [Candidatus Krumholzibacteriota bacterium]|nr:hypothetical protein [Candidatus Krumholzibacteriota bacterium]